jgi:hypothetical protein
MDRTEPSAPAVRDWTDTLEFRGRLSGKAWPSSAHVLRSIGIAVSARKINLEALLPFCATCGSAETICKSAVDHDVGALVNTRRGSYPFLVFETPLRRDRKKTYEHHLREQQHQKREQEHVRSASPRRQPVRQGLVSILKLPLSSIFGPSTMHSADLNTNTLPKYSDDLGTTENRYL